MSKNLQAAGPLKQMRRRTPEKGDCEQPDVCVLSPSGHYVYMVPESEARDLIRHRLAESAGEAIRLHEFDLPKWMAGSGYIEKQFLRPTPPHRWPASARDKHDERGRVVGTYPPIKHAHAAWCYRFKPIPTEARPVFRAVQTSCIAPWRPEYRA